MSIVIKRSDSKEKIDKMIEKAIDRKDKKTVDLDRYFGKVKFESEGLEYQKKVRDEWEQDRR